MTDLLLFFTVALTKVMPQRAALAVSTAASASVAGLAFIWWRAESNKIDSCNTIGGLFSQLGDQGSAIGCQIAPVLQIVAFFLFLLLGLHLLFMAVIFVVSLVWPDFDMTKDLG